MGDQSARILERVATEATAAVFLPSAKSLHLLLSHKSNTKDFDPSSRAATGSELKRLASSLTSKAGPNYERDILE